MEYGIQLFTLRKYMTSSEGIEAVFKWIREKLGAGVVQLSGACQMNAKELSKVSSDYGIKISCTHSPYKRIINDLDALAEEHLTYGCKVMGLGCMPAYYRKNNFSELGKFIDEINEVSSRLKKYGMSFAYHNHFFEFQSVNGKPVLDTIFENTESVEFILDTYWVHFARQSNEEYIEKLKGRLRNVHFKDYRKALGFLPLMCEVGRGFIDFPKLIPLFEKAGTEYALIEQDISVNPYKSVETSWNYLQGLK